MLSEKKGNKVTFDQPKLQEYLSKKLQELANLMSNILIALIVISLLVLVQTFRASDLFLYGLIIVPVIIKRFIYSKIESYLRKNFQELLDL